MAIKKYWDFADEASVPTDFTELEGGNGAVSINNGHLRIDNGGTASGDYAGAVFKTALDDTKYTIIYGELKMSGVVGAWTPLVIGLLDSASTRSSPGRSTLISGSAPITWSAAGSFRRPRTEMSRLPSASSRSRNSPAVPVSPCGPASARRRPISGPVGIAAGRVIMPTPCAAKRLCNSAVNGAPWGTA